MNNFEILFVDDDKDILFIVEKYLTRQGYSVTVVDNGIKALGLVKKKDLVGKVLDLEELCMMMI